MTATFDTLEYVETLKAAGVPEDQAKAHAKAMTNIADNTLATKQDIQSLRMDMKLLESRMTNKLGTMFVIAVGIILAGIKYL
jgi:hypothetical protein